METALFLFGQVTAAADAEVGALSTLVGALIGLIIAIGIGYALYRGKVINLRTFFRWTGIALIFIAAGLLSHAVHEFVEIGVITFGTCHRLRHQLGAAARGRRVPGDHWPLLRAMFGYTSSPSGSR